MSHSVARHLRIEIASYDRMVREFIPDYDAMLTQAADAVAARVTGGLVLDLGAGTGALSERLLERGGDRLVELVDVDQAMLDQARLRLARFGDRVRVRSASFDDPLPPCDAVMASLALHHVPDLAAKAALYRRIAAALRPGGVLVNADATMPDDPAETRARFETWAAHMARAGIDREQAFRHFAEWAGEDHYFPLERELEAMAAAGLRTRVAWTSVPTAVMVGEKPAEAGAA